MFGNILEAIGQGPDRSTARRQHQAFADAIDRGDITIISTPTPIMVDLTSGASKMLTLNNGTLAGANPCWDTSDSDDVQVAA